jgi:hypothetical protein
VVAPIRFLCDVFDDDGLAALTDFVADGCRDFEFAARLQTEVDAIKNAAGQPAIGCDACNGRESHSSSFTDNFEDGWNRSDFTDGLHFDSGGIGFAHVSTFFHIRFVSA